MKATLSRVRFNELLGSPLDMTIQAVIWLCSAS